MSTDNSPLRLDEVGMEPYFLRRSATTSSCGCSSSGSADWEGRRDGLDGLEGVGGKEGEGRVGWEEE